MKLTKYEVNRMLEEYSVDDYRKYVFCLMTIDKRRNIEVMQNNTYTLVGNHLLTQDNNLICMHVWSWNCSNGYTYTVGDQYLFNLDTMKLRCDRRIFDTSNGRCYSDRNDKAETFNAMLSNLIRTIKKHYPDKWNNLMNYKFKSDCLFMGSEGLQFTWQYNNNKYYNYYDCNVWLGDILLQHVDFFRKYQGEYCKLLTKGLTLREILKNPKKLYIHSLCQKRLNSCNFRENKTHVKYVFYNKKDVQYIDMELPWYYHDKFKKMINKLGLENYSLYTYEHGRFLCYNKVSYNAAILKLQYTKMLINLDIIEDPFAVSKKHGKSIHVDINDRYAARYIRAAFKYCESGTNQFIDRHIINNHIVIKLNEGLYGGHYGYELIPILKESNIDFEIK